MPTKKKFVLQKETQPPPLETPERDHVDGIIDNVLEDKDHPLRKDLRAWLKRKIKSIEKAQEDAEKLKA